MPAWKNQLYFGDNLSIMREHISDASVDLIYLDPPFNSKATYNVLFKEKNGSESSAQITAFDDTWHWDASAAEVYHDMVTRGPKKLADLMLALHSFLGQNDMMAYLTMMAVRLVEMRRVLKDAGSIYLHCDPTASHYLKVVLDAVFGKDNFLNEIVWKRTSAHSGSKRWGPVHDLILLYSKSQNFVWNHVFQEYSIKYIDNFYRFEDDKGRFRVGDLTGAGTRTGESGQPWRDVNPTDSGRHWAVPNKVLYEIFGDECLRWSVQAKLDALDKEGLIYWPSKGKIPGFKRYFNEKAGVHIVDVITDINPISAKTAEKLGYPTQKPEALLERIIHASSNDDDVVLDPFCGCGTTVNVAERLHRRWIGIDITHLAITLIKHRLEDTFRQDLAPYEIIGDPKDMGSARALAAQDKFQFEWWALSLVDARPAQDKKKGADRGVDGYIYFFDDESGQAKKVVVQVKGGHLNAAQVRDLKGTIEREKAVIGVFITLEETTGPMRSEAADAGFYEMLSPISGRAKFPRIQIFTVEELLNGAMVKMPAYALEATIKRAERKKKETNEGQLPLL